ncbi:MAG: hypothetical protein QW478_00465 [Candidatus Micrarchaeaceae archaeon]
MEKLYIKPDAHLVDDKISEEQLTIDKVWKIIFNQESVPILAAKVGFRNLFSSSALNDDVVLKFVMWLSKDNESVSLNDIKLLLIQLGRKKDYIHPNDKGAYTTCGYNYYRALGCVARVIYDVSLDPGFHNKLSVVTTHMEPCEYIFRKTNNPNYLFVFEYRNKDNKIVKYGIKISSDGEYLVVDNNHKYKDFSSLRDYLVKLPMCESGMSPFKIKTQQKVL